jgi:hypothetical protein
MGSGLEFAESAEFNLALRSGYAERETFENLRFLSFPHYSCHSRAGGNPEPPEKTGFPFSRE